MRPSANPDMMVNPAGKTHANGTKVTLSKYISNSGNLNFEDWGRPISNTDMSDFLFGIIFEVHGVYMVNFSSSYAVESLIKWTNDEEDSGYRHKDRLYGWRVFTDPKMNWNGNPTYGEFTSYLIKLMGYNKSMGSTKLAVFTNDTIKSFAIGGNTSANAKITWEQAATLRV